MSKAKIKSETGVKSETTELWAKAQLDAGGFVGLDVKVDEKSTETMIARSYSAPVLGERVVIRLTSERLVPAEDLSMEFLGLQGQAISAPIAKQHRTALEFGHWALIHQPQHARYALDLVKRMKAAARKAASKAGHAWDLYMAMSVELDSSVRHFLPSFWEQAARAYKELGNTTYAGRALTKALEAERVHSLEVDREHRRDAILEFTLSGCLSGKALTDYGKDLEKQFPPLEAYETYKDLMIRRTLGGMAPIANCASDLSRMAKAAGLDVDAQIEAVLEAIMTSPAMARAPFQFWKSVKKQVGTIVARNPSFAVRLLVHTNPTASYSSDSPVWEWIDMLDEWKVLPYLSLPASKMPSDVEIPGGRTGWFSRLASVETSPNKRVFELLELMAYVIRAEKQPLTLGMSYKNFDVDVLDMALDLGLDVAIPEGGGTLDFEGWFREVIDHPRRNSQLNHLCNHELFRAQLIEQIPDLVKFRGDRSQQKWGRTLPPRRSFEEAAAGHDAIKQAWWEFLDKQLTALETGGLADFESAEENLSSSCRPKTAEQFPELVSRLSKVDINACLHRTLVAGVFDELGWAELDRVSESHPVPKTARHGDRKVYWAYPQVSWLDKDALYFVSPASSSSCEVLLKKSQNMLFALQVGSQYAIVYYDSDAGWKATLRWSADPSQNHEQTTGHYVYRENWESVIPVGSDGVFAGERVFREGDTVMPSAKPNWYHDGQRFWRITGVDQYQRGSLHLSNTVSEIDPATGKVIRESIPPFFEEALPAGAEILWRQSHLMTKPEQPGVSPLGESHGLIGLRCVKRRDGAIESTGIDGRRWLFTKDEQPTNTLLAAVGIINKPASDSYWIATNDGRLIDAETRHAFGLYTTKSKYFAGTPCELPLRFIHSMRVRCEKTSKALRSLSRSDADKLLAAGEVEREARQHKEQEGVVEPKRTEATRTASKLFPQAPAQLIKGIAGIARVAADEKAAIQGILARLTPQDGSDANAPAFNDEFATQGFKELVLIEPANLSTHYYSDSTLGTHIPNLVRFFTGHEVESTEKTREFWFSLLTDLPGVVWRTFWKRAIREDSPEDFKKRLDSGWLHSLRLLAHSGLLELPGSMTLFRCIAEEQSEKVEQLCEKLRQGRDVTITEGSSRYVAYLFFAYPDDYIYLLGYNPKGECKAPKNFEVEEATRIDFLWTKKQIMGFLNALSKLESLPLPSPEKLDAAAARLGLHPISVALLWLGNLRTTLYGRGQEKLSKELREFYGWKVKDIQVAVTELEAVTIPEGLYSHCLKEPNYLLTKAGHNFDAMVDRLAESRRALEAFPPEISKELDRAFPGYNKFPLKEFNELIMAPDEAELLKIRKVSYKLPSTTRAYSTLEVELTPASNFDGQRTYGRLAKAISIINYNLPVGHSVRRRIPAAIAAIQKFLDNPDTLLSVGSGYMRFDATQSEVEATISKLKASVGKFQQDANGIHRCETELFSIGTIPPQFYCFFHSAKLRTEKDLNGFIGALQPVWPSQDYGSEFGSAMFVMSMRSDAMRALSECNASPTMAEGLWEQCPLHSVPALVAECAKKLKLPEMAATLYLQLLALPDPTSANIKQWNGWDSKQLKSAGDPLLEKELVVEAKRERAGRELFLPGGWEPLKAPNLPIESWKLPLFGYQNSDRLRGGMAEFIVFEGSIQALFEKTWQRWKAGDVPAYAEAPAKPGKAKKKQ